MTGKRIATLSGEAELANILSIRSTDPIADAACYLAPDTTSGVPAPWLHKESSKKTFLVATLGNEGTCSDEAARYYLKDAGYPDERPVYCASFFEAAARVAGEEADAAVVPAAFEKYNEIVFGYAGVLSYRGLLYTTTPEFVLAARNDSPLPYKDGGPYILASHHAPKSLSRRLDFEFYTLDAQSNVAAAEAVLDGRADYCITQTSALNKANEVRRQASLVSIKRFGAVGMLWAVLHRGQTEAYPAFRNFELWK
jgi:hypothetical protein